MVAMLWLGNIFSQDNLPLESPDLQLRVTEPDRIPRVTGQMLYYDPITDADLQLPYTTVQLFEDDQKTNIASIEEDGSFVLPLDYALPYQSIFIRLGEKSFVGMVAHTDLHLVIDLQAVKAEQDSFYRYEGTDAALNRYMESYHAYAREERQALDQQKWQISRQATPQERIAQLGEIYRDFQEIDAAFVAEHPSPYSWIIAEERLAEKYGDTFISFWGKERDEGLLAEALAYQPKLLSNYGNFYYRYLYNMLSNPPPSDSYQILEDILTAKAYEGAERDSMHRYLDLYKSALNQEAYDQASLIRLGHQFRMPNQAAISKAMQKLYQQALKSQPLLRRNILAMIGRPDMLWERVDYLEQVIPVLEPGWHQTEMQQQLAEDQQRIADLERLLAPDALLNEPHVLGTKVLEVPGESEMFVSNHETVAELLSAMREAHPDTAIIIDVWTTWCGPCIYDMKQSRMVKQQLKKMPVKVIYLCMASGPSNQKDWKRIVTDMQVSGDHIFLPGEIYEAFMEEFDLRGFPSCLFMTPEGEVDTEAIMRISYISPAELKKKL